MENKTQKHSVGKTIKLLRKERKLTQAQLAKQMNVSDKSVSKWEKEGCKPDFDVLIALSDFFEVSLDYLMTGKTQEAEIITISKLELCAKDDSEKLFEELKKEKKLSVTDENGKSLLDYVYQYKSLKVFKLISESCPLTDMSPKLLEMLLLTDFPITPKDNSLSNTELTKIQKRCRLAGLDIYWFSETDEKCLNEKVLDLILYHKKISKRAKPAYMEICTPEKPEIFEMTVLKAIKKRDEALLTLLSGILHNYNRDARKSFKLDKKILNSMLDNGLFDCARAFDEGFGILDERDYRLAELRFTNAPKEIIMENEFIYNGLIDVKKLLETKDLALIKRCLNNNRIHYIEHILEFYKTQNYKDLFALAMYLNLDGIVDAIILDSDKKIEEAIEALISSYRLCGKVLLREHDHPISFEAVSRDALTINLSCFGEAEREDDYEDGIIYVYFKSTRFSGVETLKDFNEKVKFIEEKIQEAKAEIIEKAKKEC